VFLQTEGAADGDATNTEAVSFNGVDKGAGKRFFDDGEQTVGCFKEGANFVLKR